MGCNRGEIAGITMNPFLEPYLGPSAYLIFPPLPFSPSPPQIISLLRAPQLPFCLSDAPPNSPPVQQLPFGTFNR